MVSFVSPITLALLEDSGWCGVDYGMARKLVEGVHRGCNDGCEFLMSVVLIVRLEILESNMI